MDIESIIRVPYTTAPNMVCNIGAVYNKNPDPAKIQAKTTEILRFGQDLYGNNAPHLVGRACEHLGLPCTESIEHFAMNFEEDVAIVSDGRLEAICFCFPSSWIPRTRLGWALGDIHRHVADSDRLTEASVRIAQAMATRPSFRRYVWTISNSGDLSQHPDRKDPKVPQRLEDLYFRCETQTTEPLGDGRSSLFFVGVDTCPLIDIWDEHSGLIKESVGTMTDAVLDYKNLRHIKNLLFVS